MFRKLLFAGFLPTLLVLAPAAAQQSPASTPVPPSSGLLLANIAHQRNSQVLGSPSVVQYETLWIVRDAAGARIIATLPDIVIPRKTGFWRLGIQHACHLISVGSFTGQSETCEPRGGHLYSDFWVQSPDSPMQLYS